MAAHRLTSVSPSQAGSKYQHQFILCLWIDPFFFLQRDAIILKYHLEKDRSILNTSTT